MLLIDGSGCEEDPAEAPEDPELNRGLVLTVLGSSSAEDEFVVEVLKVAQVPVCIVEDDESFHRGRRGIARSHTRDSIR